ncbi:hypothetical protein [Tsuneonella mangrovi]|uniref:hypothetical protein n=1 Tax=Tsuneonella mangrovi TaxID=1982042 RepID=UPI00123772C1|nr:hypothetical protein [Tsuneonella mangrovi]
MRMFVISGIAFASLALAPLQAADSAGPKPDCHQEITQLCGMDRTQFGACLQQNFSKLSKTCQTRIKRFMAMRREEAGDRMQHRDSGQNDAPPQDRSSDSGS